MNHIKQLQKQNEILKEGYQDLLKYLRSSKFHQNEMVNVKDIFLRIEEIKNKMLDETESSF